ncbi:MAG TPA: lysophospholipid acyltransferase family protein [Homoserinimonas sp.]|nr:lysophospholipid acyltransferase family protein [Homoserinimonas sp.]
MKRQHEPIYTAAIVAGRALFGFWRIKRDVSGAEKIPGSGGAVIAMTHFGYLDFALVEWATWLHTRRRIRFMAKKSVFDKPIVGSLMRGMRHIPVDMKAGADAYRAAVDALRAGELIGVFPEAGVSASFSVRHLKSGAVRLAAEAGVPIIPVSVWGGHRLMTKNRKIRFAERFGMPVCFSFGDAITVEPAADVRQVTSVLRDELQQLTDGCQRGYPVDGTGQWWQPRDLGGTAPTPAQAAKADAERDRRRQAND